MQIDKIRDESLEKEFKITLKQDYLSSKVNDNKVEFQGRYKMPGFRPGKVSMDIINKKFGKAIYQEVLQKEIEEAINSAVRNNNLEKVISSQIKPDLRDLLELENKEIEFTVKFEVSPKVIVPDLKNIKIEKKLLDVKDSDIEKELEQFKKRMGQYEKLSPKTKAKLDHKVIINFEGFVDGKAFEGGKAEDFPLILGSKSFIEGFEEQIIGLKSGDEKTIKVTFPEHYHAKDLANKEAEFVIAVKEIQELKPADLTDEVLKKHGYEDLEYLKSKLKEKLEKTFDLDINTIMRVKLFDQLEKMLNFDVPQSMLDREFKILWDQVESLRDTDPTVNEKDPKTLEEYYKKVAMRRVRVGLFLAEYAQLNKIALTEADIFSSIVKQASEMRISPEQLIGFYRKQPSFIESLKGPILEDKAVEMIFKELEITESKLGIKELEKYIKNELETDPI